VVTMTVASHQYHLLLLHHLLLQTSPVAGTAGHQTQTDCPPTPLLLHSLDS
jgi:hypothetical protein